MNDLPPRIPARAPQKRAEETRRRLLDAATEAFAAVGFDGIGVTALEDRAGVRRRLLAYHFGSKEGLWRAVVDRLFSKVAETIPRAMEITRTLPTVTPFDVYIAVSIFAAAAAPELPRIVFQEGRLGGPRLDYLIDNHLRRTLQMVGGVLGFEPTVFDYYFFAGACTLIYASPHQARRIWGVDPFSDAFIADHIKAATALLQSRKAYGGDGAAPA